ncbi:hypothetical protein FJTKL_12089 [Diaporthe vaccinii]|uniref:Trichodiene oxygenase n=1 Tax=Diaporthe vaccinii TaxID=105482 RepID=A0ABR4EF43_9PEZI
MFNTSILHCDLNGFSCILSGNSLLGIIVIWALFKLSTFLYNISPFHPLSQFPGPKLAHMTFCYEAWYDLVNTGRYTSKIEQMHKQYGPLIRINPSELHCNDPRFIDEIYATGRRRRNKSIRACQSLVAPIDRTGFGTVDHDLHRARRSPMGRHFSRQHVLRFEPEVKKQLQYLCDKLLSYRGQNAFDITMAYSCFTTDIISAFSFGEPLGLLTQEGWEPNWRQPTYSFLRTTLVFRYMPLLKKLVGAGKFFARRGYMGRDVRTLIEALYVRVPEMVSKALAGTPTGCATPFRDIAESPGLSESDKELDRLSAEAMAFLMAGTETTAWSLSLITFHLLSQPGILSRLIMELKAAVPEEQELSWVELEKIPYLRGVILEGLRLSYGVSGRTSRIAKDEDLIYRGSSTDTEKYEYIIPRGFAVGMSSAIMHHNEEIFPDSEAFLPERWMEQDENRHTNSERYLLSFSRGSRQCLGMSLAYCELYLGVAFLTLKVFSKLILFETTEDDVRYDHDLLVPMTRKGSRGVRVVVA